MTYKKRVIRSDPWAWLKYLLIGVIKGVELVIILIVIILKFVKKMVGQIINGKEKVLKKVESKKGKIMKAVQNSAKFEAFGVPKVIKGEYKKFDEKIMNDSLIVLIFGKRGSGKSSLGFKCLENISSKTGRKCFALGVSPSKLPSWIGSVRNVENAPEGAIVLIDEGAISFGARDSMSAKNKELTKVMAVARHKDLSLIFVTQNTGFIDKNILALTDTLMIKEGSLLQIEMERPEVRKFYEKSEEQLKHMKGNKKKFVYVMDSDFEGIISYNLPSFWSDKLSKNKK